MGELTIKVTDETFKADVLDSNVPVLVDFWAEWCSPCHMIAPHVDAIAEELKGKLKVAKVDIDENPAVPGRYGIVGIPTLMLFQGGKVVERVTGALPKGRILAQITPHLEDSKHHHQHKH